MTNCGMVMPADGYLEHVQEVCKRHGTYFLADETHTFSTGWGGYTGAHGLQPDFFVVGKSIAGGIPVAAYGFTEAVSDAMNATFANKFQTSQMGIGGTLSGNAFVLRAMQANLEQVATREAFDKMIANCNRVADGLEAAIAASGLPWSVTRCGARCELQYVAETPKNGSDSHDALDWNLIEHSHLYLLNRNVMITPFHNMILCSPETTDGDADRIISVFGEWMQLISEKRSIEDNAA
jgi:glutamate-1-semialdehyde 2,1-aminomutase